MPNKNQPQLLDSYLVGGWTNPPEKNMSKWESSPTRGENKQIFELPQPRFPSISMISHTYPKKNDRGIPVVASTATFPA